MASSMAGRSLDRARREVGGDVGGGLAGVAEADAAPGRLEI